MKPVPQTVSSRFQRWSLLLRAYEYQIVFKKSKYHSNADALSRLPVLEWVDDDNLQGQVPMMEHVDNVPVNMSQVRKWTAKHSTLSLVHSYVLNYWPEVKEPQLMPYHTRRLSLSAWDGCVLWGDRTSLEDAPSVTSGHVLYEKFSKVLLAVAADERGHRKRGLSLCVECQQNRKLPSNAPLHPWERPELPWSRIQVDYAAPFFGKMFLVIIDAHSKWLEDHPLNASSTRKN